MRSSVHRIVRRERKQKKIEQTTEEERNTERREGNSAKEREREETEEEWMVLIYTRAQRRAIENNGAQIETLRTCHLLRSTSNTIQHHAPPLLSRKYQIAPLNRGGLEIKFYLN